MYCGCNPTALSSQKQISDTLIRLMGEKPYSSITICELCRESGISRQTFYSLFRSIENVVLFTLRQRACDFPDQTDAAGSLEQFCRCYSRYICANRDLLKLLVENDIVWMLYDSIYESLLCRQRCSPDAADNLFPYAAHFLAGGLTGLVRQYCAESAAVSDEALYAILHDLVTGAYFR